MRRRLSKEGSRDLERALSKDAETSFSLDLSKDAEPSASLSRCESGSGMRIDWAIDMERGKTFEF